MPETEILSDYDHNILSLKGFNLEVEKNTIQGRVAIYIKNGLDYTRRTDLEGADSHLVIFNIKGVIHTRLVNLYRSFNPANAISARSFLKYQLNLLKIAYLPNTIVMGDFNIDYRRRFDINYTNHELFNDFDDILGDFDLQQLVK